MGLSYRKYAAHRKALGYPGGTLRSVQKALQSGRIDTSPDGTIDPAHADAMWAGNTFGESGSATGAEHDYQPAAAGTDEAKYAEPKKVNSFTNGETLTKIRQRREFIRLQEQELSLSQRRAQLVEVAVVTAKWENMGRLLRNAFESLPQRVKAQAPDMPIEYVVIMERNVHQIMHELASYEPV